MIWLLAIAAVLLVAFLAFRLACDAIGCLLARFLLCVIRPRDR